MSDLADLDDPANAAFTDRVTWYLGEMMHRACRADGGGRTTTEDPPRQADESVRVDESMRADAYRLARASGKDWPIMPRRKLNWLIESGNPLYLFDGDHYFTHPPPPKAS